MAAAFAVLYRCRGTPKTKGENMPETPARYVFLTLPTAIEPILNLSVSGEHPARYLLRRDQLFALNSQIADALVRGYIEPQNAFQHPGQMELDLQVGA